MKSDDQQTNDFDDEAPTNAVTIASAVIQHARDADGVPETLADDVPTAPIKIGAPLGEPPALPATEGVRLDLTDLDDPDALEPGEW